MVRDRLNQLREILSKNDIDVYIIQSSDFHQSEYTGAYFNTRQFMSGFTGSAGTLVVTADEAVLFTDGRYFIQAEKQLQGTGIELMKMGVAGTPEISGYVESKVEENGCVAFDGRTVDAMWGLELEKNLMKKNAVISYECDHAGDIWADRPIISKEPVFMLDIKYAGESAAEKLSRVRAEMIKNKADIHIIATLDDVCWLFNIRGNDVMYNPVVLSFAVVTMEEAYIFADSSKFSCEIRQRLLEDRVYLKEYDEIYSYTESLDKLSLMIDKGRINYALYKKINNSVNVIAMVNPSVMMKAVKNKTEISNLKAAHIKDGVAVTKFIFWLKKEMKDIQKMKDIQEITQEQIKHEQIADNIITEITASDHLEKCRREQEGFIEPSFDTISAYNSNAAMMHYSATIESAAILEPEGMLLVDSGGQYFEGTTDVTRTIALGNVSEQMRKDFTLTLKGMLNLANARFLYGCTGLNLDILARGPLWEEGIDYRCGTGHGIGYLLNVHESPNGFRWKNITGRGELCVLEEGMVTSDEPGVYVEGKYGIRIENEIVCRKAEMNEYGQFMEFEMLTLVPIDLELIDEVYFDKKDRTRLNKYHKMVYENLSPYLNDEEEAWLKYNTREI